MDQNRLAELESLLKFPGDQVLSSSYHTMVLDASVLTCGCLVSESYFLSTLTSNSIDNSSTCPNCHREGAIILGEIKPLRDLYEIILQLQSQAAKNTRRRSSLKRSSYDANSNTRRSSFSTKGGGGGSPTGETIDLLGLFYKFAKEENNPEVKEVKSSTQPIEIKQSSLTLSRTKSINSAPWTNSGSISPHNNAISTSSLSKRNRLPSDPSIHTSNSFVPFNEDSIQPSTGVITRGSTIDEAPILAEQLDDTQNKLLDNLNETKEYNFSKCFPFYRKMSTFPTQQMKFNFTSNPFKLGSSMIKKNSKFISSHIHTYVDNKSGREVTRFVLMAEKRWEVYEYIVGDGNIDSYKPILLCCGKLNGDYGSNFNNLIPSTLNENEEVILKNEFSGTNNDSNTTNNNTNITNDDIKKKLNLWELLHCKISSNYLIIAGTKGIMRVFNVNERLGPLGKPLYTYVTNFPIRCISISPNGSLIACGITARERLSGKEQPFIVLNKLIPCTTIPSKKILDSVEPITITIPYRDPIKLINFNASSTHLLCCTAWESRYLIIRLRSAHSDNYRRPRLIWADAKYSRNQPSNILGNSLDFGIDDRKRSDLGLDENDNDVYYDTELMMDNEGVTDLQFGSSFSNTVVLTTSSLKNKPSVVIRLDGPSIDSRHTNDGTDASLHSSNHSRHANEKNSENSELTNIKDAEIIMRFPEIGSMIHGFSMSPRGDGIVFLDKTGKLYLVSTPNFRLNTSATGTQGKKIVVLLGEVSNAEHYTESASVKFSSDGGKVFTVDRKGIFSVFDFTKGIPGEDLDVVKCKIINL